MSLGDKERGINGGMDQRSDTVETTALEANFQCA